MKTARDRATYLEACVQQAPDDVAFLAKALGDVARARGMTRVAKDAGVTAGDVDCCAERLASHYLATAVNEGVRVHLGVS